MLDCAGLLTVTTMSWTNFVLDSDFKWLLLAPPIAWLFGLVSYAAGRRAKPQSRKQHEPRALRQP